MYQVNSKYQCILSSGCFLETYVAPVMFLVMKIIKSDTNIPEDETVLIFMENKHTSVLWKKYLKQKGIFFEST